MKRRLLFALVVAALVLPLGASCGRMPETRWSLLLDAQTPESVIVVPLPPDTDTITLTVQRPTASDMRWPTEAALRASITVVADDKVTGCHGQAHGGERRGISVYRLVCRLTWGHFGARAGSHPRRFNGSAATVRLSRLTGRIATIAAIQIATAAAPAMPFHNSVAFDAATDAQESSGDGVLSLSHTASGSNRAAFAGTTGYGNGSGPTTTSITYGGSGMTEMWDLTTDIASNLFNAGYYSVAPATSSQTVTATVAAAPLNQFLQVITMTGVDQSTPVGTHQTTGPTSTSPISVTVGSVGVDDLVVDQLAVYGTDAPSVGADQTVRNTEDFGGPVNFLRGSTQAGSSGGVMSWTATNLLDAFLGAVAFKPSAGGGPTCRGALLLLGSGGC